MDPVQSHNNQVILAPAERLKANERSFQRKVASCAFKITRDSDSICGQTAFNISIYSYVNCT